MLNKHFFPGSELFIFPDGKFTHYSATLVSNFVPQKSRICDLFAYYDRVYTEYEKTGTHDYTPGANSVRFTTLISVPSFGPVPPSGTFTNSCHLLIFTIGSEETYTIVYQKQYDGRPHADPDPMNYLQNWFD